MAVTFGAGEGGAGLANEAAGLFFSGWLLYELAALAERVGPRELSDVARVADEPGALAPDVDQEGRRLHGEGQRRFLAKVEHHLMGGAGRGGHGGAVPAELDGTVQMAAQDALHLRVTLHDLPHREGALQPEPIHVSDAGEERGVVHEDHRGPPRRFLEPRPEPGQALLAHQPAALPRHQGVEADEPHRILLEHVVQEASRSRQIVVVADLADERAAVVMIAGDEIDRHGKRRQQLAQVPVLVRVAGIDEVAGREHDVGARGHPGELLDAAGEKPGGVDPTVGELPVGPDVHVRDLRDDHRVPSSRQRSSVKSASGSMLRWTSSPAWNSRRAAVSRMTGVGPTPSTTRRVLSPRKKAVSTRPLSGPAPASTMT